MPHCPLLAPPPSNLWNSLPVTPPSPPDSSVTGQFFFSLIYNWHLTQKCLYVLVIRVRVFNMKNIFDASLQYTHFFKSEFLNLLGVFVPSTAKIVLIKTCFSYTCMYLHIASYKDQVNRALIFFLKRKKVLSLIWLKTFVFSIFFIMTLPSFSIFTMPTPWCISCSSALLAHHCFHPPSHIPLLCQSVDLATFHFLFPATYLASLMLLPSLHTSGSLLCWWGQSPIQDVWACSFPPHHLLRCSLAPSLNGEPSPRRRGRAMHGPQSPFSQNHETTSSTAFLQGRRRKKNVFF